MGIHVGTPVIYDTVLTRVGKNVVGKSFDDRVGLTIMILIAEELSNTESSKRPTVTFVSTVMEELGAKGAAAVARELDVDEIIVPADVGQLVCEQCLQLVGGKPDYGAGWQQYHRAKPADNRGCLHQCGFHELDGPRHSESLG